MWKTLVLPVAVLGVMAPMLGTYSTGAGATGSPGSSPVSVLPEAGTIEDWVLPDGVFEYDAESLWEYINGAAEGYLAYDFLHLATGEYLRGGSEDNSVVAEIYQMKDPVSAFGIYSSERLGRKDFIDVGVQGYLEDSYLVFWDGEFYVKLTCYLEEKEEEDRVLLSFAQQIDRRVSGEFREPEIFSLFPDAGKIEHSERYIAHDFLGHGYLKAAFVVDFDLGEESGSMFVIGCESAEQAETNLSKYRRFVKRMGTVDEASDHALGDSGFFAQDRGKRPLSMFREDNYLFGTNGLGPTEKTVEHLLTLADGLIPAE
jgi:hypothetical protein